jgi:hypothetical protein
MSTTCPDNENSSPEMRKLYVQLPEPLIYTYLPNRKAVNCKTLEREKFTCTQCCAIVRARATRKYA